MSHLRNKHEKNILLIHELQQKKNEKRKEYAGLGSLILVQLKSNKGHYSAHVAVYAIPNPTICFHPLFSAGGRNRVAVKSKSLAPVS